jgi:hypothetical protein
VFSGRNFLLISSVFGGNLFPKYPAENPLKKLCSGNLRDFFGILLDDRVKTDFSIFPKKFSLRKLKMDIL